MGSITRVAVPGRLTDPRRQRGWPVHLVGGAWRRRNDGAAASLQPASHDGRDVDREASEVLEAFRYGPEPTILAGAWLHGIVRAGIVASRTHAAVPPTTPKADDAPAVPGRPALTAIPQTTGRPRGRPRKCPREVFDGVLATMVRQGGPASGFKNLVLIAWIEELMPTPKAPFSDGTEKWYARQLRKEYRQLICHS